jgi:hypothetical protein
MVPVDLVLCYDTRSSLTKSTENLRVASSNGMSPEYKANTVAGKVTEGVVIIQQLEVA